MELTPRQVKDLMDAGLTPEQIRTTAAARGDTVPGPTLVGTLATPFVTAGVRAGQLAGSLISMAAGRAPVVESSVLKAPGLGTIAIPAVAPINTERGREQILGATLEQGGTFFPVGRAAQLARPFLGRTLGTAASLGTAGYGIETGMKLQEGAPEAFTPGLGTVIPAGIPIAGKALSFTADKLLPATARTIRFGVAKSAGLSPEDVTTLVTRPAEFQAAKAEGLSRVTLGEMVSNRVDELTKELSDVGPAYTAVRMSDTPVVYKTNIFDDVLKKNGIDITEGRLVLTKDSPALTPGDVTALERVRAQFGFDTKFTGNQYLNLRQALDGLADWNRDPSRTALSADIARDLRRSYDDIAKVQLPALKQADEAYAPARRELENIKKDFLTYRDGRFELSDNALTKILNATGKSRVQLLERLETYVPGITQQIQLVRAIEGIESASGIKVGAYAQTGLLGGGAVIAATANPIVGLLTMAAAIPEIVVPIIVQYGKTQKIASELLAGLTSKILQGKTLTNQELVIYKNALIDRLNKISPGDQFFDTAFGQRVSNNPAVAANASAFAIPLSLAGTVSTLRAEMEQKAQDAQPRAQPEPAPKPTTLVPRGTDKSGALIPPKELDPMFDRAYEIYPEIPRGLLETILMQESSMGTDDRNRTANAGKYGWLGGITKTGRWSDMIKEPQKYARMKYFKDWQNQGTISSTIGTVASIVTQAILNNDLDPKSPEDMLDLYDKYYKTRKGAKLDAEAQQRFKDMFTFYANRQAE